MPSVCRRCRKPVRWAKTVKGKRQILDAEPNPKGNVIVDEFGNARMLPKQGTLGEDLIPEGFTGPYLDHHASCAYADEFR